MVVGVEQWTVRTALFILTILVIILAFVHSLRSPSMKDQERACAQKCQAEGYRTYEFTRPGVSNPKSEVVPASCKCVR